MGEGKPDPALLLPGRAGRPRKDDPRLVDGLLPREMRRRPGRNIVPVELLRAIESAPDEKLSCNNDGEVVYCPVCHTHRLRVSTAPESFCRVFCVGCNRLFRDCTCVGLL